MKLMDLLCSSNGSTAVVTSSTIHHRSTTTPKSYLHHHVPCSSSQLFPINPKPHFFENHRKSTSSSSYSSSSSSSEKKHNNNINGTEMRRHSCVELSDLYRNNNNNNSNHRHSTEDGDGSSRRYLLSDAPFIDWVSESDNKNNKIPISIVPSSCNNENDEANKANNHHMLIHRNNNCGSAAALSSSSLRSRNQVVVLRVSLHCKACEGKLRKHISKMEGVTSFSIERETKKVTIMGDVTPLGVLASVSKVKSAQLWPFDISSSSSSIPQSPSST